MRFLPALPTATPFQFRIPAATRAAHEGEETHAPDENTVVKVPANIRLTAKRVLCAAAKPTRWVGVYQAGGQRRTSRLRLTLPLRRPRRLLAPPRRRLQP